MSNKIFSGMVLALVIMGCLGFSSGIYPVMSEPTRIVVPEDYSTIQEAVSHAAVGDVVFVKSGAYYGNVDVDKEISLVGQNRDDTIIDGLGGEAVLDLQWYVNISGFTICNGGTGILAGFHNVIANNSIRQVTAESIKLDSDENEVVENSLQGSILVDFWSEDNIIERNNITGSVSLYYSGENNTVSTNRILNGGIYATTCDGQKIIHNYLERNYDGEGITLFDGNNNIIFGNEIVNCCYDGIGVSSFCSNLTIVENTIRECRRAIYLTGSPSEERNHMLYHNNFINNEANVFLNGPSNVQWDDGYPSGGNYWSDYNGTDLKMGPGQNETGRDNIGDTPYAGITGFQDPFQDRYPLVNPFPYSFNLEVVQVDFNVSDTSLFRMGLRNSVNSFTSVNVTSISLRVFPDIKEIGMLNTLPSLPMLVLPNTTLVFTCFWNWTGYQDRSTVFAANSQEGYVACARQTTPFIAGSVIRVPQDYSSISLAVDHANPGDTLLVSSGVYREHITIEKRLTLVGQDRENTIIDGENEGTLITVKSGNVNITGFTIKNAHSGCITVYSSYTTLSNITISGNIIRANDDWGDGVGLTAYNSQVKDNLIENCFLGLSVYGNNNSVTGNTVKTCSSWEFCLGCSNSSILSNSFGSVIVSNAEGNTLRNNLVSSIYFNEIYSLSDVACDMDSSNLVNGKKTYYFVNKSNIRIDSTGYPDAGFLGLVNCSDITVKGLTLEGSSYSSCCQTVLLAFTNNSVLTDMKLQNTYEAVRILRCLNNSIADSQITGCWFGVCAEHLDNSTLKGNTLKCLYGLSLTDCSGNIFYRNNFANAWNDVLRKDIVNSWDNGAEGNYWSVYNGTDADQNGIGDTAYIIDQDNRDDFPLMTPYLLGDVNRDAKVNIVDISIIAKAFGTSAGSQRWNSKADLDENDKIDIVDITIAAKRFGQQWT